MKVSVSALAAEPLRRPHDQGKLDVERAAGAEIAADIVHDHANIGFRHTQYRGEIIAWPHRSAGTGMQRISGLGGVIHPDRRAWFHRHAGYPLNPGVKPDDMRRSGECRRSGGCVAKCRINRCI